MNPILFLTHNNLALTRRAWESALLQDIPITAWFVDNGSTDGTVDWLKQTADHYILNEDNAGVSFGWNEGLGRLFGTERLRDDALIEDHVLVCNTDIVLPTWFYETLLSYNLPFVSGVAVDSMIGVPSAPPDNGECSPHPDFSAFLIARDTWEMVGPFDEAMKHYASDCDFHIRAHRKGVRLLKAPTPFYHERSSTLRLATPEERAEIEQQANRDRAYLRNKWSCEPGTPSYEALFREELFGIDRQSLLAEPKGETQ